MRLAKRFQQSSSDLSRRGAEGVRWEKQHIRDTLGLIDRAVIGAVAFVDDESRLLGFITDGDIRRALIKGANLDDPIENIWTSHPLVLSNRSTIAERHDLLVERNLDHIIVADEGRRNPRVQSLKEIQGLYDLNPRRCPILLMAGGRGVRLMPLTENCPKPMLDVAGRPLLHHIVENIAVQGFEDLFISVRYLKEKIIDYFGDGSSFGVNIQYLEETDALGTGGCLRLLPPLRNRTFLIMNGDVVTDLQLSSLVSFHENEGYHATMVVHEVKDRIAYGVVRSDGTTFKRLDEKPDHSFRINTGIYAVNTAALDAMPERSDFGLPDLFTRLTERDRECGVYEHQGRWVDIGDPRQLAIVRQIFSGDSLNAEKPGAF